MKVGFLLFSKYTNTRDAAGSRIRGEWLIKYWPEAEVYIYGQKYDAVIYQKVFDISHATLYDGVKILDICDPEWFDGRSINAMIEQVDGVTCSSPELAKFFRNITDKPVLYLRDRHDLDYYKEQKIHKGRAKSVVWFGYSHNAHSLRAVLPALSKLGLSLTIISDKQISLNSESDTYYPVKESWKKWSVDTVNLNIIKNDIVVLPPPDELHYHKDKYKSNNRKVSSWLLGMPIARTKEDLIKFLDEESRVKEGREKREWARKYYDVKLSVKEMKEFISEIQRRNKK